MDEKIKSRNQTLYEDYFRSMEIDAVRLGADVERAKNDMRKVLNFEVELVSEIKRVRNIIKLLFIINPLI